MRNVGFLLPNDQLVIFCSTSKKDSFSAPCPCWDLGPARQILCTSSSSLVSLQPSVFVLLIHSIGYHTVVFCVCSGKLCTSWVVLMTCCSNDSSLRRDLGGKYLWESQAMTDFGSFGQKGDGIRAILDSVIGTMWEWNSAIFYWPVIKTRTQRKRTENQMETEALSGLGGKSRTKRNDNMQTVRL